MIFSLFDIKAEVFGPLFEARTLDEAKRLFISVLLQNGDSNANRYPQDHQLYHLGDFDNSNGSLVVNPPNMILTGFEACQQCNKYKDDLSKMFTNDNLEGDSDNVNGFENSDDCQDIDSCG